MTSAALRIGLLGRFTVEVGNRRIPEGAWRLRKAGHIVKLLALAPEHRLHRDAVIDALWPEFQPAAAANNLYRTLSEVRRILEPCRPAGQVSLFVRLRGDLIDLSPIVPVEVDVQTFRRAGMDARRRSIPELYDAALAHCVGDFLPEDRFDDWTVGPREELTLFRLALLLELAALRGGRLETDAAIEALVAAVAIDPTLEAAQTELIRWYAASGRRAQAIRQYETFREVLRRDFGVEPPAPVEQIVRPLLNGRGDGRSSATDRREADGRRRIDAHRRWFAPGQD